MERDRQKSSYRLLLKNWDREIDLWRHFCSVTPPRSRIWQSAISLQLNGKTIITSKPFEIRSKHHKPLITYKNQSQALQTVMSRLFGDATDNPKLLPVNFVVRKSWKLTNGERGKVSGKLQGNRFRAVDCWCHIPSAMRRSPRNCIRSTS